MNSFGSQLPVIKVAFFHTLHCNWYTVFKISVTVSSTDGNVDLRSLLDAYYIQFSEFSFKENRLTGDTGEHTGLFCHQVACSKCDLPSEML